MDDQERLRSLLPDPKALHRFQPALGTDRCDLCNRRRPHPRHIDEELENASESDFKAFHADYLRGMDLVALRTKYRWWFGDTRHTLKTCVEKFQLAPPPSRSEMLKRRHQYHRDRFNRTRP